MSVPAASQRADVTAATESTSSLAVRELARGDEARWDRFVEANRAGSFYHLAGWRRIFEDVLHHRSYYLVCERAGELEAVLPLVRVRSLLFGDALISVPFLVYGGPVANSDAARDAIVRHACELARELGVDRMELRNVEPMTQLAGEPGWHDDASQVTFRKEIDPDPDACLQAIPRKQRAMIRKGQQAGLEYSIDDDTGRLHAAMLECKRNLGTPFFGRRYLQSIKDTFGERAQILTVTHDGKTVCSVMSFRYRDEILPYYGGGGDLARIHKGNDFMYWCVMEQACRDGVRIFDYGRSQEGSGAYRFKKHWGFEPTPLAYRHYLVRAREVPHLKPDNPKYSVLVNLWKRLPLPVADVIGPPLARRLG